MDHSSAYRGVIIGLTLRGRHLIFETSDFSLKIQYPIIAGYRLTLFAFNTTDVQNPSWL